MNCPHCGERVALGVMKPERVGAPGELVVMLESMALAEFGGDGQPPKGPQDTHDVVEGRRGTLEPAGGKPDCRIWFGKAKGEMVSAQSQKSLDWLQASNFYAKGCKGHVKYDPKDTLCADLCAAVNAHLGV